jgi:hypothetical protein
MSNLSQKEEAVLIALMSGEYAEPLGELAWRVEANPAEVGKVLDGLVEQDILRAEVSYHQSDLGEVDYLFAFTQQAQEVYCELLDKYRLKDS